MCCSEDWIGSLGMAFAVIVDDADAGADDEVCCGCCDGCGCCCEFGEVESRGLFDEGGWSDGAISL